MVCCATGSIYTLRLVPGFERRSLGYAARSLLTVLSCPGPIYEYEMTDVTEEISSNTAGVSNNGIVEIL